MKTRDNVRFHITSDANHQVYSTWGSIAETIEIDERYLIVPGIVLFPHFISSDAAHNTKDRKL